MIAIEDVLSELAGGDATEQGLPPGFRFHPTDEELVTFYLASKVFNGGFCGVDIAEVDLNRCEPWELPERAKMGEREWYFFSLRDRKYPTGLRTNRATAAGYWKATGKDKEVYGGGAVTTTAAAATNLLGMKKTLVFYKGRAPRGVKTKWVMHEYRFEPSLSLRHTSKEEWVICRVFHKAGDKKKVGNQDQNFHFGHFQPQENASLPPLLETPGNQNPFDQNHHENEEELKTLINPFQSSFCVPKQCRTEHSELNYSFQDPLYQAADYSLLGLVPSTGDDDVAAALNRIGFHMMLDSIPSGFPAAGESWPLN